MKAIKALAVICGLATTFTALSFDPVHADMRPQQRPAQQQQQAEATPAALPAAFAKRPAQRPQIRQAAAPAQVQPQRATVSTAGTHHRVSGGIAHAVRIANSDRARGKRIWCVPFARNASGVEIRGDARTWWHQAAGRYDRSAQPREGAVMNFRATRGMSRGHVAVVSKVVHSRKILIDHANWHRNRVSLGMGVVDVSENNDWSRVRVESSPGTYGSVYPVYGFILASAQ